MALSLYRTIEAAVGGGALAGTLLPEISNSTMPKEAQLIFSLILAFTVLDGIASSDHGAPQKIIPKPPKANIGGDLWDGPED